MRNINTYIIVSIFLIYGCSDSNKVLPKILIVVHMAGQSRDMLAIHELSKQYGFKIVQTKFDGSQYATSTNGWSY